MVIAVLALLGVDLIVLVGFVAVVVTRRRWVKKQPGAFRGLIRVTSGEIHGCRPKWSRGYGRWVRDVLVWTKGPFCFRNEILAMDGLDEQRLSRPDEVKRLGDQPVVARLGTNGAMVEVAAAGDDHELLLGPFSTPARADNNR